jgi:hypothetical protein
VPNAGAPMTPTIVSGLSNSIGVSIGSDTSADNFVCVLQSVGTVKCWGNNSGDVLGVDPSTTPSLTVPGSVVTGLTGAAGLSSGPYHSCVTASDGTARCWGMNMMAQLGLDPLQTPFQFTPNVIASW